MKEMKGETETKFIDLTSDFGFKKLFGEEPNKDLLISFLNEVFQGRKVIRDLEYARQEELGDGLDEGGAIFDLVCTGTDGEKFIIEVQRARQENFEKRALFYTSRLISNQAPKGRRSAWGYAITEVYLVALLDGFTISDAAIAEPLHDICLCYRDSGKVFYEGLGYIYIELPKFLKTEEELQSDLDRWLFVLKNMSRLNKIPVYLRKSIFEKVFDIASYNKLNKEERMAYEMSLKKKWDDYSIKQTAFNDGKKEGVAEGEKRGKMEEKLNFASKLLTKGYTIESIVDLTGLSEQEVAALAQKK